MKGWMLLSFLVVAVFILLQEWPGFGREQGKAREKAVFLLLLGLGVMLAVLLRLFPDAPGPTDLVETMFHPLADWFGL